MADSVAVLLVFERMEIEFQSNLSTSTRSKYMIFLRFWQIGSSKGKTESRLQEYAYVYWIAKECN